MKRPIKILCIDDEADLLDLLKNSIETLGHTIITAKNVEEAKALIQKENQRLALIISDFSMPGKTGFDLRKETLEEYKHIPFVLISGNVSRDYALEAIDLKIAGFVPKPYQHDELIKIVTEQSKDRIASILEDDELRDGFIVDTNQLIEEMESTILLLEDEPTNVDLLNRIFACAHTIKGTSGFFKPDTIHRFMHKYEDFLSKYKKGLAQIDVNAIQILLKGLDNLKSLVQLLDSQSQSPLDIEDLLSIFQTKTEVAIESPVVAQINGLPLSKNSFEAPKAVEELRIAINVLNDFMEKSGEITVLRNMVNKVFSIIENSHSQDPNVALLADLMEEMHKAISNMQDQVADLKKVSLTQVVKPLMRSLRDLSVNLKKPIRFDIKGEALRVDHCISEVLNKCLIHLLRNSADHGIESPTDREKAGKTSQGTISLSFSETPEEVIVIMSDDGKGIDPERIKKKAIERGLLTVEQAEEKSASDIRMMIFEPGFSTSEQVTDVSGRGVGTDMVKQVVTKIGGRIELNSEVGKGTQFILKLPIPKSVLIINSLMIRSGDNTYALPQENIDHIIGLENPSSKKNIKNIGPRTFYSHHGKLNPILNLPDFFDQSTSQEMIQSGFLVRLRSQDSVFCLHVDDVLGAEDIVVKSIGSWFKSLNIYKGATFMGDGKVGLVLDVDGMAMQKKISTMQTDFEDKQDVLQSESQQMLTFKLDNKSLYALKRSDIFRIEHLSKNSIYYSGTQMLVVYRNQPMTLINLNQLLSSEPSSVQKEFMNVIVVQNEQKKFVGYIVNEIHDLIDTGLIKDSYFSANGNSVHTSSQEILTVLDTHQIHQNYLNKSA